MSRDEHIYSCQLHFKGCATPERLALASLLHGGPSPDISQYRLLEVGCGAGANLIPLAYYRPQAEFIGVDLDSKQVNLATARSEALKQSNISFRKIDLDQQDGWPEGPFDFILIHDLASKVPSEILQRLFHLCSTSLAPEGLLYLNYDSMPGWNIRNMVREYLLAHNEGVSEEAEKIARSKLAAEKMTRSLHASEHPYRQLLASEFKQVSNSTPDELALNYLNPHQNAFWRSELLDRVKQFGLSYVADADYNIAPQRTRLRKQIESQDLIGTNLHDTEDLLSYCTYHLPLFSLQPIQVPQPPPEKIAQLHIAACLYPVGPHRPEWYQHPNGYQLHISETSLANMLEQLRPLWPRSVPLTTLLETWEQHIDDLLELNRSGLLELRLPDAPFAPDTHNLTLLNQMELQWHGYYTTSQHQRIYKHS